MPPHKKMRSRTEGDVIKSGPYTNEEDAQLIELYEQHSDKVDKWKIIAGNLNRNYKSIRERYVNHLDQTIDKSDLTADEKREIDDLQTNPCYNKKYRNKWPEIAKKLSLNRKQGRRTELQIKNYWNSKERTQKRKNKNKERSYERISNIMNIKNIIRDV
ncbi:hypothetical protein RhiirA5_400716 [Rhizophagus irregularis]|uniref:Myb-like domain-containing protein n=2 Tax=Rhizophagus irregularis TaxID=588596 RepID=A0A2N0PG59_9GLOM|nr:hypothetical protein GLOIN_2v1519493 [Rhizophagus irregularis DAOM 181602=DAOM 197198]PKC05820.1 hypothetical protein RhiirA5_400716 [Rhizophagus irregularis]PKC70871.1 hypothetical protein RhiirA1_439192 [Rhizophagus irregularis]POG80225.1 hypothetical protein GLOIN_2v1519493 [Rhizophagus irregularis DAOM 181602=DAOM 197198]UZO01807.1 hypothetical protein OCT59_020318 [Rhizophagus irregularis]CAB4474703.1 unnamed protein product [Rhizophagus irregularis]|eukprot:XP_025187091.1 hypothetical protein GLOIN_2v1519493 [Rhizophagus irregularis DAOM 181602=DAOM 197198]